MLNGGFKHDPQRLAARSAEPVLPAGIGSPPEWLDQRGADEWRRVVPDLEGAGVTSRVEAVALAAYCQAVSRLIAAEAEIARDGITFIDAMGTRKKHPAVGVAERAAALIRVFASEFGMTPSSRSRVHAVPPKAAATVNEFAV